MQLYFKYTNSVLFTDISPPLGGLGGKNEKKSVLLGGKKEKKSARLWGNDNKPGQ